MMPSISLQSPSPDLPCLGMAVITVVEAQCDCDDLAKASSNPPPVLAASLRKWSLPEMAACVLGDELGKGSTGVVLRASLGDGETVVPVAVKVLREATSACALGQVKQRAERLGDLRREMLIATKLPWHENIPVFLGVYGIDSDCPKAVWELIDGETLEQIFASRSQREVAPLARLSWCRQLFSALACLHSNNMVHRDVKPANVMVTKDLTTVKLVDYGLCREIRDDNTQCPVMTGQTGSFRYMAPEVLLESNYGLEVDIYSAAMCAYYIIAGSAPFSNLAGQQVAELAARVRLRPALASKGFENPRLGDLMARAWAHDAAKRPDASACVREIELIIADEEARLRLRSARSSKPVQVIHRLCKAFKDHIDAPVEPQKRLAVTRARRNSETLGGGRLRFFSVVEGEPREEVNEDTSSGARTARTSPLNLANLVRVRFSRSLPQKAGSRFEPSSFCACSSSPVPVGPFPGKPRCN
jgi:serine/threonine protein kinase